MVEQKTDPLHLYYYLQLFICQYPSGWELPACFKVGKEKQEVGAMICFQNGLGQSILLGRDGGL